MYYLSTVIDKLVTPDAGLRRADRQHQLRRSAKRRDCERS
jgi:hypothetical protein